MAHAGARADDEDTAWLGLGGVRRADQPGDGEMTIAMRAIERTMLMVCSLLVVSEVVGWALPSSGDAERVCPSRFHVVPVRAESSVPFQPQNCRRLA